MPYEMPFGFGLPEMPPGVAMDQQPQDEVLAMVQRATQQRQREQQLEAIQQQGIAPEHMLPMAAFGLGPVPGVAIPAGMALASKLPRLTGAMGGLSLFPSQAEPAGKHDPEIEKLQRDMRRLGVYDGKIDGIDGPATRGAIPDYQKAKAKEDAARAKQEERDIAKRKADAEALGAEAAAQAEKNKAEQEVARQRERAAGEARLDAARQEENTPLTLPWLRATARDYGPTVGYLGGALAGMALRKKIVGNTEAASQQVANEANGLMAAAPVGTPVSAGDIASRFPPVNQFWSRGGATEVPFPAAPGTRAGIKANPDAPQAGTLYPKPPLVGWKDVAPLGAFGLDVGFSTWGKSLADQELKEANEAVGKDPSAANIQRLQLAKDKAAIAAFATNFGYGGAGGYIGDTLMHRAKGAQPSTVAAESERAAIDQFLRTANNAKGGMKTPTLPPLAPLGPAPSVERPIKGMPGHVETPWGVRGPGGKFVKNPGGDAAND